MQPRNVLSAVLRMLRKQWRNMNILILVVEAIQFGSTNVENVVINGNMKNLVPYRWLGGFKEHIPFSLGKWRQSLEICRYVNQMMEELVSVEEMLEDKDEDVRFLAKLVIKYQELLERNQVMDFASIQTKTYHMLKNHPDILKKINDSIKYIMVDEYQDTNPSTA